MADRHIVALGGWPWDEPSNAPVQAAALEDYVLGFARGQGICFVPTAVGDAAESVVRFYSAWRGRGELSHVEFFPWPPERLRELILGQDVIVVSGGNTANALAIWRTHGFDAVLREAWESGVVLTGWSAGMLCWFEAGVTDSFGPQLQPLRDGLGFLAGSACPHYDSEERRRSVYTRAVANGLPAGVAADDCVALHYTGTELAEAVTARKGASAYRVDAAGEYPLQTRLLGG